MKPFGGGRAIGSYGTFWGRRAIGSYGTFWGRRAIISYGNFWGRWAVGSCGTFWGRRANDSYGTIHRTTQKYIEQHNNYEECGPCPVFAGFTLAFALQLRKKHEKTSVRICHT
jgi:hypothetical protein